LKVKINQIKAAPQIALLKDDIDIANLCLSKTPLQHSYYITPAAAEEIKAKYPLLSYSLFFDESFSLEESLTCAEKFGADFIELKCPDFPKKQKFEAFLELVKAVKMPKIISGFSYSEDDFRVLKEARYFEELIKAGENCLFQIDFYPLDDKKFFSRPKCHKDTALFFARFPTLFPYIPEADFDGIKGVWFNIRYKVTPQLRNASEFYASNHQFRYQIDYCYYSHCKYDELRAIKEILKNRRDRQK